MLHIKAITANEILNPWLMFNPDKKTRIADAIKNFIDVLYLLMINIRLVE